MPTVEHAPNGSLATILAKNAFLNLVSLSFYRFWARTNLRRYFWSSVRIGGEPLEYTGQARELFIGFLIVAAILTPLAIVWSVVDLALEGYETARVIGQITYLFALYLLWQAAGFRARRYRLTRTLWRGIRAGQDGRMATYLWLSVSWGLVTLATFGLAMPATRQALQRYRIENTRLGNTYCTFDAPLWPLMRTWLVLYLSPVAIALMIAVAAIVAAGMMRLGGAGEIVLILPVLMPILAAAVAPFAWVIYRVREFRYFAEHTRLGPLAIRSQLRAAPIFGRLALFLCAFLIPVAGASILAAYVFGRFSEPDSPIAAAIAAFLTSFLLGEALWTGIVTGSVLRQVCRTTDISGLESSDQILQSDVQPPVYGEGLADGFDFGSI